MRQGDQRRAANHENPAPMAQGRPGHWQGRCRGDGDGCLGADHFDDHDLELPDLLTDLQDKTQLTRRSLVRILTESERLEDFKRNPQEFIDLVAESINRVKRMAIVDGIKYQRHWR